MTKLKVCFVGIGSIAKRHIRNLKKICCNRNICLEIDAVRRKKVVDEETELGIRKVYTDYSQLNEQYDVIFDTNPTEVHISTLNALQSYGKHFFVEKPIVSINQINIAEKFVPKPESIYYVACPLRYNAVIQYIKENVDLEKVISARSISSSYLPDWRPGIDYRKTYSAQKKMGGGVSIDLIHEWDYLTHLFGFPKEVQYILGKKSGLEIDCEDIAIYIGEYETKLVELHLDYFGRKTLRELMLFTSEDTIVGDIAQNVIYFLKTGEKIKFEESRDDFQIRELEHFLDIINGKLRNDSDIEHAIKVLKLTQGGNVE